MTADRRRLISLIATVLLVALAVAVASNIHLYRTALSREKERLSQTVQSQARLISAVARFDAIYSADDNPEGAFGATLSQIRDAHEHFQWFGETGEFAMARAENGEIVYLLKQRYADEGEEIRIPKDDKRGEPMRLALQGKTGTVTAPDYRGEMVLAAYAPVPELKIGLVAKVDMREINAPYVRSTIFVAVGALLIAGVGMLLMSAIFPLIQQAETAAERERSHLLAILDSINEPVSVTDPKTYKILYANEAFKKHWGEGVGRRCYEVLENGESPCGDCIHSEVFGAKLGESCTREYFNKPTGRWFRCLDKAIHWPDGSLVHYEMAIDITREKESGRMVEEQREKVRALSSRLALAEEQERKRLATQLHDSIGHSLVTTKMKLVELSQQLGDSELKTSVTQILEAVEGAIGDTRSLTFEISPPVLHDLGLGPALEWLAGQFAERHSLKVEFTDAAKAPDLNRELSILLFQAARELLFNVFKHAAASKVELKLAVTGEAVLVTVQDDGKGFDASRLDFASESGLGYGLLSISERMHFLGGEMRIESQPGLGTTVRLSAPLSQAPATPAAEGEAPSRPAPRRAVRVLIADDHELMRRGMHSILNSSEHIEIVGEAADGRTAMERTLELRPNVVVMDIDMPDMDGISATRSILRQLEGTRVLALSMHANKHFVRKMLAAGARGYLLKDSAGEDLARAIDAVDSGEIFLSQHITGVLVEEFIKDQPESGESGLDLLTPREAEVVRLLVNGYSTKQVASSLDISQKTAQVHRQNIFKKLGIESVAELVKLAFDETEPA